MFVSKPFDSLLSIPMQLLYVIVSIYEYCMFWVYATSIHCPWALAHNITDCCSNTRDKLDGTEYGADGENCLLFFHTQDKKTKTTQSCMSASSCAPSTLFIRYSHFRPVCSQRMRDTLNVRPMASAAATTIGENWTLKKQTHTHTRKDTITWENNI